MALLDERAILVALHVKLWGATIRDQEINEEVTAKHKASADSGSWSKRLIARKHLQGVYQVAGQAGRTHRLLTLPWEDGGTRILSTMKYLDYIKFMKIHQRQYEHAANEFCKNLPAAIDDAKKTRLGTMFVQEDYPTATELKQKFSFDVEIKPVMSAGDFRAKMSDETVKAIVKDIERRTDERLKTAMNDVFERIAKVTGKMVESLKAYKPVAGARAEHNFGDTLVWNIKDIAEMLPSLNITGDKRLEELQERLLDELVEHGPDVLRADEKLRRQTVDKAEKILKKVQSYMA